MHELVVKSWTICPIIDLDFEDEDVKGDWADRSSKDTVVNSFGKSLLNLCFLLDCVILNGCCNGDCKGEYTYMSPHGSSAIDYFIVSEDLFSTNCNLRVGDRVDSWHMPVELCWSNVAYNIDKALVTESRENRVAWSEEFVQTYKDKLCSTNFKLCVQKAVSVLSTNVDKSVDIIVRALYGAAACMVKTVGHKKKKKKSY